MEFREIFEILRRSGAAAGGVKRRIVSGVATGDAYVSTAAGFFKILNLCAGWR